MCHQMPAVPRLAQALTGSLHDHWWSDQTSCSQGCQYSHVIREILSTGLVHGEDLLEGG